MIQHSTSATPRLDEYRKQVFLGLQELQTRADAAGGIEFLFAPQLVGRDRMTYVSAAWSWSKQAVELVPHAYAEFPAECGGDLIRLAEFPAECGGDLIRLAGWDSEDGGDYLAVFGDFELDLAGVQSAWVSILYSEDRSEEHRFEEAMALMQNGGVPLDIEWEALCVTPEQLLLWLGHERSQAEWNSRLYGGWGVSSAERWADSFWYPAVSAALEHFQSEGRLIYDDMDEYQVRTMIDWLEYNDDHGLALNELKDELARLEAGDDDEDEDAYDAEHER